MLNSLFSNVFETNVGVYVEYLIFFTLPWNNSHTKTLSFLSTDMPYGLSRPQLSM
eukprot:GAHX01003802.1.p1 GENE.GAHX01003802.1~~GAHX01003802.1.p1  ORF type:complete len:55 (+),score=4.62 GAHX01003802.1:249-413(+)